MSEDWATPRKLPQEPGVADIAQVAISRRLAGIPDTNGETAYALRKSRIIEDIKQDIICKTTEQIAMALVDGQVRHVRVVG